MRLNFLNDLPPLKIIEELKFENILAEVETLFKSHLAEEVELLESDTYKALLETLAYRELLLRARINASINAMLLPTSSGDDLDNVVSMYGIERLQGESPKAEIKLELSAPLQNRVTVPKGTVFSNSEGKKAFLCESVVFAEGATERFGVIELEEKCINSEAKCELIQTPLPFVVKAKQLSHFLGGASKESDEALKNRAVLSLHRFSTAGSRKGYEYHALSASVKVLDVSVRNGGAGVVDVFLRTADKSEETRVEVERHLSGQSVRPLCDTVRVFNASLVNVNIKATIELDNMLLQSVIDAKIKEQKRELSLGEDLSLSYIYKLLHQEGVASVKLLSPVVDTKVNDDSYINITFELSYVERSL